MRKKNKEKDINITKTDEVVEKKGKKSKNKKKKIFIIILVALLFLLSVFGGFAILGQAKDHSDTSTVKVLIPSGSGTNQIASILYEEGIIKSEFAFKLYSKIKFADGKMQAGTYNFSPSMSVGVIIDNLTDGITGTGELITIPEGYTITQMAELLEESGIVSQEEFLEAVEFGEYDYEFMKYVPESGANRLEGFLFPESYMFEPGSSGEVVVDAMLREFDSLLTDEDYAEIEKMGYDLYEIIILASIIEKETALEDDIGKVSSVFHNRLDINMSLGSCATVNYATGKVGEGVEPTASDLRIDSPYNTRIYAGMPPGPICSPGKASIIGAIYPEDTDYLYFVVKEAGSLESVFTTNLADHEKAAEEYYDSFE